MQIYSPNMLKTYLACPKKYYYKYVEHLSVPASVLPFEKGKKIHALANYYLQGINISRIETALSDEEKILWERLKQNEYFRKDFYASEYQLSCKVGDYWTGGRIDAVVFEGNNYYILDYKTGQTPKNPEFDPQTMVYLLCLDRLLKNYGGLAFVYINLKENSNKIIPFSKDMKSKYEKELNDLCRVISSDKIYNPNLKGCANCEMKSVCPHVL